MKNIVVPIDFSSVTQPVVDLARLLAKSLGAGIHLVHVKELVPVIPPGGPGFGMAELMPSSALPMGQPIPETLVPNEASFPNRSFDIVKGRIGHVNLRDPCQLETSSDMILDLLIAKPPAEAWQIAFLHIKPKQIQRSQNSTTGFRNRRMLQEQMLPHQFGLSRFRERPELVVGHVQEPKDLRNQVMINQ